MDLLTGAELAARLNAPAVSDELAPEAGAVVVDWADGTVPSAVPTILATVPAVLVGIAPDAQGPAGDWCDVLVPDVEAAAQVVAAVDAQPTAAAALALLLREPDRQRSITDGLLLESATYSALQASAGHQAWLGDRPPGRSTRSHQPVVTATRDGNKVTVTLNRPERRNAYNAQMRDELLTALGLAVADPEITDIELRATGPNFSSGGDLTEFGTGSDPGRNHLIRLSRSTAAMLAPLADRLTVRVHGPCVGAGVELAAFAGRVVAAPDTTFQLPELAMGLIPGAGGTVSLPRRIGRHRTAWLAITGRHIDARTALHWGLVDAID